MLQNLICTIAKSAAFDLRYIAVRPPPVINPYCVLSLGGERFETDPHFGLNPVWNQGFHLPYRRG